MGMGLEQVIVWLAVIGALDSLWVALQQKFPNLFQFCFSSDFNRVDCYNLLHTKYAAIFKVLPNSWFGMAFYTLLIYLYKDVPAFASLIGQSVGQTYMLGAILSSVSLGVGLYLLYVQAKVLRTFCIFCLTSTTLITLITAFAWVLV